MEALAPFPPEFGWSEKRTERETDNLYADSQNLQLINGHLQPFIAMFCQIHKYLSQNWGSNGHFEVFNRSKSKVMTQSTNIYISVFCEFEKKTLFVSCFLRFCVLCAFVSQLLTQFKFRPVKNLKISFWTFWERCFCSWQKMTIHGCNPPPTHTHSMLNWS